MGCRDYIIWPELFERLLPPSSVQVEEHSDSCVLCCFVCPQKECILGISQFIKDNPRATQAQINEELEKRVLVFAARVHALEKTPLLWMNVHIFTPKKDFISSNFTIILHFKASLYFTLCMCNYSMLLYDKSISSLLLSEVYQHFPCLKGRKLSVGPLYMCEKMLFFKQLNCF